MMKRNLKNKRNEEGRETKKRERIRGWGGAINMRDLKLWYSWYGE